jgi:hypothetical protein
MSIALDAIDGLIADVAMDATNLATTYPREYNSVLGLDAGVSLQLKALKQARSRIMSAELAVLKLRPE